MEDAKIDNGKDGSITQENAPLYQQGKYPSIIDTDDLVFEIGKQIVVNLNKEKLLDALIKKNKIAENNLIETKNTKLNVNEEIIKLKSSNKSYIETNRKLDSALVKIRQSVEELKNKNILYEKEVKELKKKNVVTIK